MNKPYSPETLAERWGCSANHIRGLIRDGQLRAFRVGTLYRIPADVVDRYEQCDCESTENIASNSTGGSGLSHGLTAVQPAEHLLARQIRQKRNGSSRISSRA